MPTIKDIAKAAGVSHGTVSNVLNGRGNVSAKKIKLVEEAAAKLGYKLNYKAQSLRSGVTKSVSIIIPNFESEEYAQMYEGLDRTLSHLGYRTHLYITYDLPHNEKNILKEIAEERVTGIVTISCLDDAAVYYKELNIPKENIIFINREVRNGKSFASFDFAKAGKDISAFLAERGYRSVGIFADEQKYTSERLFADAIVKHLNGVPVKVVHAPMNQSYSQAFAFFEKETPEIIVASSLSRAYLLKNAHYYGSEAELPQIVCLAPTQSTYDNQLRKYGQNYKLFGHDLANLLIEQVTGDGKSAIAMMDKSGGMDTRSAELQEYDGQPLTVLTIPSPTTDALHKLLPHFTKETGIRVLLAINSYEEIYQILADHANNPFYDLIRMDMAWLSWFGKNVFHSLSGLDSGVDDLLSSLPQHMKDNYSCVQGTAYTLPFDPSVQMLFYRKDLFEDQMIKRTYFEKHKKQLTVPTDYESYNELVRFFSEARFPSSPTPFGTSVTLGRSEIIAAEFLIRYYAEGGRLVNEDGLRLDSGKASSALRNYLEMVEDAQRLNESWWGEAVNSFARGETAMVIGFMNHVSRIAHSDVGAFIGYAPVPGGAPLLGGGVIGISRESAKMKEAIRFLKWVNRTDIAEQISLLGGTTANPAVSGNFTIRSLYPWLHDVEQWNYRGVRETRRTDGSGIDTKKVELVIGLSIKKALHRIMDVEQTIEHINRQLAAMSDR